MNTIVRNILLVVVCFALGFVSGCRTIHGLCADGKTAFTVAEKVTGRFAEGQKNLDSKMEEENLHRKLSRAEQEIVEAHLRAERFANQDPMKTTTAEDQDNQ